MSEIGTLTGDDPAERMEMALGQPITSREQIPEWTPQEGKPQNHAIIAPYNRLHRPIILNKLPEARVRR